MKKKQKCLFDCKNLYLIAAAIALLLVGICNNANAFIIPTGNEDYELRWDNSFRYNYGIRVHGTDDPILNNLNIDDGDRNFDKGEVTNRLDILSEMDFRHKSGYGIRISGAFWYDQAYYNGVKNTSVMSSNNLDNGVQSLGFPDKTKKYSGGPEIELLDAFIFGKSTFGEMAFNWKIGRSTVYWGEAFLFGGAINGLSYGQLPIDLAKAFGSPGAEIKELFRPLGNVNAALQIIPGLTVFGQWFFQWENYRFPESGSYLNNADMLDKGRLGLLLAPGFAATRGSDSEPNGTKNWGVGLKWTPSAMQDATFGFYYRRTSDMFFQFHYDAVNNQFTSAYADGIDIYGISFSKAFQGWSIGAEYSIRHNMPLQSSLVIVTDPTKMPTGGDTLGARGDTQHALINIWKLVPKMLWWQSANFITEFNFCHWDSVDDPYNVFLGRDGYNNIDRVTKDALGVSINFSQSWYQVIPGWDVSVPITYSRGLMGTSALLFSDSQNAGSMSIGISAQAFSKYDFAITWNKYFGNYDTAGGALSSNRGSFATLSDRDWIVFTFKFQI